MKKSYDGLEVFNIMLSNDDIVNSSEHCEAMVQLRMENGVCVSPEEQQQIEYVGDQG